MLPSGVFGAEPSEDIHKRFRRVAVELARGISIDTAIYDKTRIFRLPNTINAKTNLHKIELYPFEALSLSIDDILERAKEPAERLDIETDYDPSEELMELYHTDFSKPKENRQFASKYKQSMNRLMQGVGQGERNNIGIRVASHLYQCGLPPKMMYAALEEWNNTNDPPLTDDELDIIFEQGMKGYWYGGNDPIIKDNIGEVAN